MELRGPGCILGFSAVKKCTFRGEEAPAQSSLVSRGLLPAEGGGNFIPKAKKTQANKILGFISGSEVEHSYSKMHLSVVS